MFACWSAAVFSEQSESHGIFDACALACSSRPGRSSLDCRTALGDYFRHWASGNSHQLHSSKLDYLGIVAAIRGFCNEYAKQHQVSVKFTNEDLPKYLPKDVSLCLFRVAQEALHNVLKYSGVAQFVVTLKMVASEIQLEVSDHNAGFGIEEAKGNGLGREHARTRPFRAWKIFRGLGP